MVHKFAKENNKTFTSLKQQLAPSLKNPYENLSKFMSISNHSKNLLTNATIITLIYLTHRHNNSRCQKIFSLGLIPSPIINYNIKMLFILSSLNWIFAGNELFMLEFVKING